MPGISTISPQCMVISNSPIPERSRQPPNRSTLHSERGAGAQHRHSHDKAVQRSSGFSPALLGKRRRGRLSLACQNIIGQYTSWLITVAWELRPNILQSSLLPFVIKLVVQQPLDCLIHRSESRVMRVLLRLRLSNGHSERDALKWGTLSRGTFQYATIQIRPRSTLE